MSNKEYTSASISAFVTAPTRQFTEEELKNHPKVDVAASMFDFSNSSSDIDKKWQDSAEKFLKGEIF